MQVTPLTQKILWSCGGAALILLAFLLQTDAVRATFAPLINVDIDQQNIAFLHDARTRSLDDLLILGEIIAALEIAQSAEIGFSFIGSANVQVGQALAGLNFALEKAMLATLAGAGLYEALILLVSLATLLNLFFFQLVLLTGAARFFSYFFATTNPINICSRIALRASILVFLSSFVILPYSINASGWLAGTAPFEATNQHSEKLENLHAHVVVDNPSRQRFSYWTNKNAVRGQYLKFVQGLPHSVGQTAQHAVSIALHALFIGILLPLGIFATLWWIVRLILRSHEMTLTKIPHD